MYVSGSDRTTKNGVFACLRVVQVYERAWDYYDAFACLYIRVSSPDLFISLSTQIIAGALHKQIGGNLWSILIHHFCML